MQSDVAHFHAPHRTANGLSFPHDPDMAAPVVAPAPRARADGPPAIKLVWFDDIRISTAPNYLIKGLLAANSVALVFGESGCGKSFLATDAALAIARGISWRGHRVKQAGVVYIAAEGQSGIDARIEAYRQETASGPIGNVFALIKVPVNLFDPKNGTALIRAIKEQTPQDFNLGLVVIDTLARTMGEGDESSAKDMGRYVETCETIKRDTGATILLIHHTGKNVANGSRGSYALPAAVDTMISVRKDPDARCRVAVIDKQRDGADGEKIPFDLRRVVIGMDDEGDELSSCVVDHMSAEEYENAAPTPGERRLSGAKKIAWDELQRALGAVGEIPPESSLIPSGTKAVKLELWRAYCKQANLSDGGDDAFRKAMDRAMRGLRDKEMIGVSGQWVWACV